MPPGLITVLSRVELGIAELTEHDHLGQLHMVINVRPGQATPGPNRGLGCHQLFNHARMGGSLHF